MTNNKDWEVYIILADDNSLYTGISNNVTARFQAHLHKKGAKFFYGRRPLKIIFREGGHNRSSASKREIMIKRFTRQQKLALIDTHQTIS